jgi:hypothetical protein
MGRRMSEANKIKIEDQLVYISLNGINGIGKEAITDLKSYLKHGIGQYSWACDKKGYVYAWDSENKKQITMHRLVSENNSKLHSDHINGNTLDNRATNLRICNAVENNRNADARIDNKTGYKNVTLNTGLYRCLIKINKVKEYFGHYENPEMAAEAYNHVMKQLYPEYARLNVIPEGSLSAEEIEHVHNYVNRRLEKIKEKNEANKVTVDTASISFVKAQKDKMIDKIV